MNELSDEPTIARRTTPEPERAAGTRPTVGPLPGSPGALSEGCRCSVLLNQPVEQGPDDEHPGFVNPLCPVHGSLAAESEAGTDPDLPVRS